MCMQTLFTAESPTEPLQLLQMLKNEVMSQCRDLFPNLPRQPTNPDRCQLVVQQPGQPNWTLAFPPNAVVKDLILAHGRLNRVPLDEIWIKDQHDNLVTHEVLLSRFTILSMGRYEDLFPIDVSEPHPEPCTITMDLDLCTQLDLPSDDGTANPPSAVPAAARHATSSEPVEALQSVTDPAVKSLLDLTPSQLTAMLPPLVADLDLCARMRRPLVSAEARLQLLSKQEHVWADDEMWWQLQVIAATEPRDTAFLDPLLAFAWLTSGTAESVHEWASNQPKFTRIATVVLHDGHWTPCLWVLKPSTVEVIMWEHADTDVNELNRLHGLISQAFGLAQFCISCTRRQFGSQLCGAAAIAFLQHRLSGLSLPSCQDQLQRIHAGLKEDFRMSHDGFFPTSLCGVLVFDSVSQAPSPPASSSRLLTYTTINLTYNNFTHTNLTYINFTHTNLTYNIQSFHTHTQHTHLCVAGVAHNNTQQHTNTHTHTCVAGVAQTHIHRRFAWQAWHKLTSTGVALMALGGALGLAWSPVTPGTPRHFAWQAWHKLTSTVVLRGRRGTTSHPPSFCVAGVAQTHIHRRFAWQAWHSWH